MGTVLHQTDLLTLSSGGPRRSPLVDHGQLRVIDWSGHDARGPTSLAPPSIRMADKLERATGTNVAKAGAAGDVRSDRGMALGARHLPCRYQNYWKQLQADPRSSGDSSDARGVSSTGGMSLTPVAPTGSGSVSGGLPSHAPGARSPLRDRASVPRVLGAAPLGAGVRVPRLRRDRGVAHRARAVDVRGLWTSGVGR